MKPINLRIAEELGVRDQQVAAAISLLDGGATVPFVARYRKEATGALDDAQLRTLEERLRYLRELDERRAAILDSISQQGKLDAALKQAIGAADSKARLEDLYLPYRPKRRTKAHIAREAGLEPLAEALLARPDQSPEHVALRYVKASNGVVDSAAALDGARAILIERFAEDATLIGTLREEVWSRGRLCSRVRAGKAEPGAKFADYFEFSEPLARLPSHRILALFRGEKEEVLTLELVPDPVAPDRGELSAFERQVASRFKIADHGRPGDRWLIDTVRLAWRTRIQVHIESDLRLRLWQAAEDAAVQVFAGNLRDLLLAPPAGARPTMGLDPGYRTGVKVAWSPGPGKSRRRRRSTRMSHSVVGTRRLCSWRGLPESIGWN
jgi:protein Tex